MRKLNSFCSNSFYLLSTIPICHCFFFLFFLCVQIFFSLPLTPLIISRFLLRYAHAYIRNVHATLSAIIVSSVLLFSNVHTNKRHKCTHGPQYLKNSYEIDSPCNHFSRAFSFYFILCMKHFFFLTTISSFQLYSLVSLVQLQQVSCGRHLLCHSVDEAVNVSVYEMNIVV